MSLETAEVESAGHTSTNHQSASHTIDTLLMDLDGTLYPIENGYEDHVRYPQPDHHAWLLLHPLLQASAHTMLDAVQTEHLQVYA